MNPASAGNDFDEVNLHFDHPRKVLRVARDNPPAELPKTFGDERGVAIEARGAVYGVADVDVRPKIGAIDGAYQLQVSIGAIGPTPSHDFE